MGKTITTYLIDGDPKGTQYVSISNKICQMYIIPRSNLAILNERSTGKSWDKYYVDLPHDEDLDRWTEELITKNPDITTQELADLSQRSSKIIKRHILKPPHIQHKGSEIQSHPSKHI